jgi:serine O-acetyltransferase
MIGAGAKLLGNIEVGEDARIAAGSVVLENVPARCTVAGVPAKPVGDKCCEDTIPAREMDQRFDTDKA